MGLTSATELRPDLRGDCEALVVQCSTYVWKHIVVFKPSDPQRVLCHQPVWPLLLPLSLFDSVGCVCHIYYAIFCPVPEEPCFVHGHSTSWAHMIMTREWFFSLAIPSSEGLHCSDTNRSFFEFSVPCVFAVCPRAYRSNMVSLVHGIALQYIYQPCLLPLLPIPFPFAALEIPTTCFFYLSRLSLYLPLSCDGNNIFSI